MSVKIPISDKLIEFLDSRKAKDQEYEDVIWDIIFQIYEKNLEEKMPTSID